MKTISGMLLVLVLVGGASASAQEVGTIPTEWHGYFQVEGWPCPPEFEPDNSMWITADFIQFATVWGLEVQEVLVDGARMWVSGVGMAEGEEWAASLTLTMVGQDQIMYNRSGDESVPDMQLLLRCERAS